jgi:hypothetical protein
VTAEWLPHLKKLTNLRTLKMRETKLTDADLKELAAFPKLESINLHGSGIAEAGVEALRAKLPQAKITR